MSKKTPSFIRRRAESAVKQLTYAQGFIDKHPSCIIVGHANIQTGTNVTIGPFGYIHAGSGMLTLGNNVSMSSNVFICPSEGGEIHIGNDCMIGPGTVMRSANHIFDDLETPMRYQGHTPGTIHIDNNVWIAAN